MLIKLYSSDFESWVSEGRMIAIGETGSGSEPLSV